MSSKNIFLALEGQAGDYDQAIRLTGRKMMEEGYVTDDFITGCLEREKEYPTGLPALVPVAIPHCKCDGIKENTVCFLRLKEPVRFYRMDDPDEYVDTRIVFNLAIKQAEDHLEFLQKLMGFVMDEEVGETCLQGELSQILDLMKERLG